MLYGVTIRSPVGAEMRNFQRGGGLQNARTPFRGAQLPLRASEDLLWANLGAAEGPARFGDFAPLRITHFRPYPSKDCSAVQLPLWQSGIFTASFGKCAMF